MKYQVGDLVDNAHGNVKDMGHISDIKENQEFIFITWFRDLKTERMSYDYFDLYFKVVSHVSIPSRRSC